MPNPHIARPRPGARPGRLRSTGTVAAVLVATLLVGAMVLPSALSASSTAKVVVVVGPVGRLTSTYKTQAREVIAEARRYTSNVVVLFTPTATWNRVRAAAAGASVFVYFGHGWGFPSTYAPFDPSRMNGMALDPTSGANGTRRVYYGEDRVRASIRLAPGAAVLLYRLCYASGNTEPGLSEGTTTQSKRRVDGFGAGFLDTGAAIVIADGHPSSRTNYIRQLFTTNASVWLMFRRAPNYHGHVLGPYASSRTPGAQYAMDPDKGGSNPSGFYRSIVGDLALRTTQVTRRAPYPAVPASPSPSATGSTTIEPSVDPGATASLEPSADPGASAPLEPSDDPSAAPSGSSTVVEPTAEATAGTTAEPSSAPSEPSSAAPSLMPTGSAIVEPSEEPTAMASVEPTAAP